MSYTNRTFVWFENHTADIDAAKAFWGAVVGWDHAELPMADGPYPAFLAGGVPRGGYGPAGDAPSRWTSYLRVADVDATAAAVEKHGGTVQMAPFDVPGVGRMAFVADPQGAWFALFHEADEAGSTDAPAGPGALHWTELWSPDVDAVLPFYRDAFGLRAETMQMPDGPYHVLMDGETMVGGAMTSRQDGVPAMWLPWIHVDDPDAALVRATDAGGRVIAPTFEVPGVGRLGIVASRDGVPLGVMRPASR